MDTCKHRVITLFLIKHSPLVKVALIDYDDDMVVIGNDLEEVK